MQCKGEPAWNHRIAGVSINQSVYWIKFWRWAKERRVCMKELTSVFVSVYVTLLVQWICLPRRILQAITFEAAKMGFSFAAEKLTLQQQNGLSLMVTNNCSCKRADLVLWCHMLLLACKMCSSFTVAHAREDFSAAELHNCLHIVAAKNWSFHWKVHIGGCKHIFVVACMHACMLQWQHFAGSNLELWQTGSDTWLLHLPAAHIETLRKCAF